MAEAFMLVHDTHSQNDWCITVLETISKHRRFSNLLEVVNNYNLVGLGVRAGSIVGKFLLITYLARVFSLAELGIYGLFLTSIILVTYLLGFEFHTYATRQILGAAPDARPAMILNQIVMHVGAYLFMLPLVLLIFGAGFLPWSTAVYFYAVVILVHIGQEIHRLLITLSRPTSAYLISFFTHGLWTFPAVFITLLWPAWQTLETIFVFWVASALSGVVLGIILLAQMGLFQFRSTSVDFRWIKQGLGVGYKFFIGIIAYRIIDLSDRYFVQYFHGETDVGVYTLFGSVANIAQDFVFAGLVALIFPKLLASLQKEDKAAYSYHLRRLKKGVLRGSVVMAILLIIGIYLLIFLLQREELLSQMPAFYLLLGSSLILNFSLIPHYQLYAHGYDQFIMWSVLVGFVINLALNGALIPSFGIIGAALATVISFSVVGALKLWFVRCYIYEGDR